MWALYIFLGILCGVLTAVTVTLIFEKRSEIKAFMSRLFKKKSA